MMSLGLSEVKNNFVLKEIFYLFQDQIQPCDSILCLDIEKTFSEGQRCFVSIFTNILVFLLQEGDCLQVIKNAHNVEITDILFFKPLKVIIFFKHTFYITLLSIATEKKIENVHNHYYSQQNILRKDFVIKLKLHKLYE